MKKKKQVEVVESPVKEDVFPAKVLQQAPNPQWVYCKAINKDLGKIAVVIPRRFTGKLVGKQILIEAISDNVGTTYRYAEDQPH
jgi:hypothetical protein